MRILALLAALAGFAGLAAAHEIRAADLVIEHPWARASIGAARTGAAYMTIRNEGTAPDRLVAAASEVAETAELHTHVAEGDVMRMRPVAAIEIPPGGAVELRPGGLHLMLMGLRAPLREDEVFPATLTFERAGAVKIEIVVEAPAARGAAGGAAGGQHRGHH
mgnify:CR=1 FL=1